MMRPGSGEPMARQGRAGGSWRPVLLLHNWSRVRGALKMTWGPAPMGSMEGALGSQGMAAKAGKGPEEIMPLYSPLTENTCFNTLNQKFLSVSF